MELEKKAFPAIYFNIKDHSSEFQTEKQMQKRFLNFIEENQNIFSRELLIGHITASAFIFDSRKNKVLLIHHKKLNKWLQPGGHCDGNENTLSVALKEVEEETGLIDIEFEDKIFDIDIHEIPENKGIPRHEHFDIRYLFYANSETPLIQNHETIDLKWIKVEDLPNYTKEESIIRMASKISHLKF